MSILAPEDFNVYILTMDDVKKMFRTFVNGQSAMKLDLLGEIVKVRGEVKKVKDDVGNLRTETRVGFKKVNQRLDKISLKQEFYGR